MGVTAVTVSRWETGERPIGLPADRFLRLLIALATQAPCPALESVGTVPAESLGTAPAQSLAVHLAWNGVDWVVIEPEATECNPATGAAP